MNKRMIYISLVALMFSVYLTQFAVAYSFPVEDMKTTSQNVINYVRDIVSPLLSFLIGVPDADKYFFQRVLLLALVFAIVYIVLLRVDIFRRNKPALFIVTFVVAVLGARYMSDIKLIETALLPYGVLAISITVFLPFLIYFFFIETSVNTSAGRKAGWILFGAVFFGLWITRYKDIPEFNWIYGLGIGAIAIVFFFDGTIHRYFEMQKYKDKEQMAYAKQYVAVEKEINELVKQYGAIDAPAVQPPIRKYWQNLEDSRKKIERELSSR